jgi:hypothetical protein
LNSTYPRETAKSPKYDYGKRWAVEGAFSLVKRIMGESVSATKTENMFHEVGLKFKFANILINA